MLKYVNGNLIDMAFDGKFDYIIHGCNCFCTMESGIAKEVKERLFDAWAVDQQTEKGDRSKLGTFTTSYVPTHGFYVINAYTQYNYGRDKNVVYFNYEALYRVLTDINLITTPEERIGLPMIGSGLARGHWPTIELIIEDRLKNRNVTVVIFDKE